MVTKTLPRLRPWLWALSGAALALFAGTGAFFPLLSLWLGCALFRCAVLVLKISGVKFERFHWSVLGIVWICAAAYTVWALTRRDFIYYWDYANYILKQYEAEAAFAQSPAAGFGYIFSSLTEDYTAFICLFTEFPFCLTSRSGNSYAASQLVCIFPTLAVLLAGLVIKVGEVMRVKNSSGFFVIGLGWCVTFPFLRMSALLSQPDWFGLIFAFMVLLLTVDFRFERLEPARCIALFFATAAIIITRRWYLYFVVGYYFAYALLVLTGCVRMAASGQKRPAAVLARNLVLFGIAAMAAMLALLWPLVKHILQYSYSSHYAYYNVGGLALELLQQALRIGLLNLIVIILGFVLAARRRLPALPCLAICELALSLVLFTRVQNSGSHQMLLFVPAYLLLFLCGAAYLADTLSKHRALKLGYIVFTFVFALSVRCSPLTIVALPEPVMHIVASFWPYAAEFVRLDTLIYDRADLGQIQALTQWIDENCSDGETAYMIPHDMLYNPDMFKNCALPEIQISDKLCFGFSVLGTHDFPTGFFDSTYVITASPFPQTYVNTGELSNKLNELFLAEKDEHFAYTASFDMGNGTVFTVWQRTVPADRAEAEYYLSAFANEDAQFPEMFSGVINRWLAGRGL